MDTQPALGMKDSDRLRDRAIRLFALALKAKENGNDLFADQLTLMANEVLGHAEEIERRDDGAKYAKLA